MSKQQNNNRNFWIKYTLNQKDVPRNISRRIAKRLKDEISITKMLKNYRKNTNMKNYQTKKLTKNQINRYKNKLVTYLGDTNYKFSRDEKLKIIRMFKTMYEEYDQNVVNKIANLNYIPKIKNKVIIDYLKTTKDLFNEYQIVQANYYRNFFNKLGLNLKKVEDIQKNKRALNALQKRIKLMRCINYGGYNIVSLNRNAANISPHIQQSNEYGWKEFFDNVSKIGKEYL